MVFDSFAEAHSFLLWSAFAIAFLMGAVATKTNFCTMGAISDWVNMGDTRRLRAWLLAIAVSLLGVVSLEYAGLMHADSTFPPYRAAQFLWAENLLGGLLFGIGITLASGCGSKILIRIGGGNLKSLVVLLIIGVIAFFMLNPFPGTDKTLMSELFIGWIRPLSVTFTSNQDLGALISGEERAVGVRFIVGLVLATILFVVVFLSADFRKSFNNLFAGVAIGLAVVGGWYVSSNVTVDIDGESFRLQNFVEEQWDLYVSDDAERPSDSRLLSTQSFTFVNPMGQTVGYAAAGFEQKLLTFGIMAMAGVTLGAFFWSLITRSFYLQWFTSFRDFANHLIGAVLMGFGGVLAMGCTIGQGIAGISTLALGSFLTFGATVFGSALTIKVIYYRMVYEQANFAQAFSAALADMRLLPASLRKLDPV